MATNITLATPTVTSMFTEIDVAADWEEQYKTE